MVLFLNKFTGPVRRCPEDYRMIKDGSTVAAGVSGGKIFGAMQRYPLDGWEREEYTRRPLPWKTRIFQSNANRSRYPVEGIPGGSCLL